MNYDDNEDITGLYNAEAVVGTVEESESDYHSDDTALSAAASAVRNLKERKKKEKKEKEKEKKEKDKDKEKKDKDKGYVPFEGESSGEERHGSKDHLTVAGKGSTSIKRSKHSFRLHKKEKAYKEKEKENKEQAKAKKSIGGGIKRRKIKDVSSDGGRCRAASDGASPKLQAIFGAPLSLACELSRCHDGVSMPAVVRQCVDYIEERGVDVVGVYRVSGQASTVHKLRHVIERSHHASTSELHSTLHSHFMIEDVTTLLKQYLREIPENILTDALIGKFEDVASSGGKDMSVKVAHIKALLSDLPPHNYTLLSYVITHMCNVIAREKCNKMNLQNISIIMNPTLHLSHKLLFILLTHHKELFTDFKIIKYVPPLKAVSSRLSLELPDTVDSLEDELKKQESVLSELHCKLNAGVENKEAEEDLWEVQRIITQLKRKLRVAKKELELKRRPIEAHSILEKDKILEPLKVEYTEKDAENDVSGDSRRKLTRNNADKVEEDGYTRDGTAAGGGPKMLNKDEIKRIEQEFLHSGVEEEEGADSESDGFVSSEIEETGDSEDMEYNMESSYYSQQGGGAADVDEQMEDAASAEVVPAASTGNGIPTASSQHASDSTEYHRLVAEKQQCMIYEDELGKVRQSMQERIELERAKIQELRKEMSSARLAWSHARGLSSSSSSVSTSCSSGSAGSSSASGGAGASLDAGKGPAHTTHRVSATAAQPTLQHVGDAPDDDDDDLQDTLDKLNDEQKDLREKVKDLFDKLKLERRACILLKVEIRLAQLTKAEQQQKSTN